MSEREWNPHESSHMSESFYATRPTRGTVFWRTFLPWQMWKFVVLNVRMVRMIWTSHKQH